MKLVVFGPALIAGSLLAQAALAADEKPIIYECKDAEGNVAYQDDPCKGAPPVAPKPKAVAKAKPATKPAAKPAAKPPAASKSKTEGKLVAMVRPKAASERRTAALPWTAVLPAAPPFVQTTLTNRDIDARWTSPQKTLQTFVGAVKTGDRALVLSCLTNSALADLGPDVDELPLRELQVTVGSFTSYVVEGDLGPFWSVRALRAGARPKWIFLERTGSGDWKIGAF